jgi:dolichol-phosphate mannosyltransferase
VSGATKLSVVMPVYNEAAGVAAVVRAVATHVLDVVPDSELVVIDDCSNDATSTILHQAAAEDGRVRVLVNEVNLGHGPSVRRGIEESRGEWILHLDSDGQVDVAEFPVLWSRREGSDLVLGVREQRHDPIVRLVLTRLTRALVSVLARHRVRDANTPFRLVSRSLFDHLSPAIPKDVFAPSVLVVLGAHRAHAVVTEVPITHFERAHGTSTLHLRRLAGAVWRSAVQTLQFSRRPLGRYVRG